MKISGIVSVLLATSLVGRVEWSGLAQTNLTPVANIVRQTFPQVKVAILGNFLHYTPIPNDRTFVYDISSPTNPIFLAETMVPARPMATAGKYGYRAHRDFSVVDISNPTNFQVVATWESEVGITNNLGINPIACDVAVEGNRAYLAAGGAGMYIFDLTNPTNLVRLGHTNDMGDPTEDSRDIYIFGRKGGAIGIAVFGHYAFLANWLDGLRIYDVSDPFNPVNVAHATNEAYGIRLAGNLAFVPDFNNVNLYDVSDPTEPVLLGHTVGWAITDIALSGNFLFVESAFQGVTGYDVSNPALPLNVSHTADLSTPYGWTYEAYSMAVSRNHVYVGLRDFGVRIYSMGSPAAPTLQINRTDDNNLVLSWPAPTSAFTVQQSSQLYPEQWTNLPITPTTTGSRNQVTTAPPTNSAFYRLVSQ